MCFGRGPEAYKTEQLEDIACVHVEWHKCMGGKARKWRKLEDNTQTTSL